MFVNTVVGKTAINVSQSEPVTKVKNVFYA